jgi:hypothetical protein
MTAAASSAADPRAAMVAVVLDLLGPANDGRNLTGKELAVVDAVVDAPEVEVAVAARAGRVEAERIARGVAEAAARQAEIDAKVAERRARWKALDPTCRALHVLAAKLGEQNPPGRFAMQLARLLANPSATLTQTLRDEDRQIVGQADRPPPSTFEGDDEVVLRHDQPLE